MIPDELTVTPRVDAMLRRMAKREGLVLRKSRWRYDSIDNHGGYMIVDPETGGACAGMRFDLTGKEVAEYLAAD